MISLSLLNDANEMRETERICKALNPNFLPFPKTSPRATQQTMAIDFLEESEQQTVLSGQSVLHVSPRGGSCFLCFYFLRKAMAEMDTLD